jgi:hypothetical protein
MKKLAPFAFEIEPIESGHLKGKKLLICDQEYAAWDYDTYIYDAIELVERWKADQVTFERIVHVRYWLRENIQHGHNLEYGHLQTLASVKTFIDQLIHQEYRDPDDKELKEIRDNDLKQNKRLLGGSAQLKQTL